MAKDKLLITLLITILLVAYVYSGTDYLKQRRQHEALTSQITNATQSLKQMPESPQDLEQRLAAAQVKLTTEQSAFPSHMNSTHIVNTILEIADECEVKAIPLVTQPWSVENVGEHGYRVFLLNVAIQGSFSQLVSFVSKLENGEFKTLIVEDLSVTKVSKQPEEGSVSEGTTPVTASLDLAIYSQSLTPD